MFILYVVWIFVYSAIIVKNNETNDRFCGAVAFIRYTARLKLVPEAEKQLQNKNHTEDLTLGSHPHDNREFTERRRETRRRRCQSKIVKCACAKGNYHKFYVVKVAART